MRAKEWSCLAALMMVCLGSVALPVAGAEPRGPVPNTDSEPNDDYANATLVSPDVSGTVTIYGTATATDMVDYYKILLTFTPPDSSEKLSVDSAITGGAACRLFIFDPNAKDMVLDADANNTNDHHVQAVAPATDYYYVWYEVQVFSATETIDYSLTFTRTAVSGVSIANGTSVTATPVPPLPATVSGTLNDPGDQADFYTINLISDVSQADVVTFHGVPTAALSIMVEVYYPNLTYLSDEFHYLPIQNGQPPAGTPIIGSFSADVPGKYYLRVLAVFGSGSYTLRVMKTTVARDDWNSPETAYGLPTIVGHYLEFEDTLGKDVDNEDYFSFPVTQGQVVNATIWSQDYNKTLDRPQINFELRNSTNVTYGNNSGTAKPTAYTEGSSPETTPASLLRVTLMTYYGGAGRYSVNLTLDITPTIYEDKWETVFIVNESSYAVLDLTTIFYDPDGDDLDYEVVNNEGAGKTMGTVSGDKVNFTTLEGGWVGVENYTITAADFLGYTAQANVLVTVQAVNHAPYVKDWSIDNITAEPGDILLDSLNLSKYFDDQDKDNPAINDYLIFNHSDSGPLLLTFQLIPGTLFQSGGVTIQVPDMPDLTEPFVQTVYFWATDTSNLSTPELTCNITINPHQNKPPRWSSNFTMLTMNESLQGKLTTVAVELTAYCTDADPWDANALTFSASGFNTSAFTIELSGTQARITPKLGFYTKQTHEYVTFSATDTRGAGNDTTIELVVRHLYTPPAWANASPSATALTMDENTSQTFSVIVAMDAEIANATPPLTRYRWYVNGTLQPSALPNFTFRTEFTSAARSPFNVTVTFNDSVKEISRSWKVAVNNVNQPPINVKISAMAKVNYTAGSTIEFTALTATDPDDPAAVLTYVWKDNGNSLGTGQTVKTSKLGVGKHNITLIVTDADGGETPSSITINIKAAPAKPFLPGMEGLFLLAAIGTAMATVLLARRKKKARPHPDRRLGPTTRTVPPAPLTSGRPPSGARAPPGRGARRGAPSRRNGRGSWRCILRRAGRGHRRPSG